MPVLDPQSELARDFGRRLFDAVFAGPAREVYESSLSSALAQDRRLRIRLHLSDAPELAGIPWELLFDPSRDYLALSATTPIVRYFDLPEPARPLAVTAPLRMLVVLASPIDFPQLDLRAEQELLRRATTDLQARGLLELEFLENPSPSDLQQQLRRSEYHILHYGGHAAFDEERREGLLAFGDPDGKSSLLPGSALAVLLQDVRSLRLVVMNATASAPSGLISPFERLAHTLVLRGIPAVIAMQTAIGDRAASAFTGEFYRVLAEGLPVETALTEGRKAILVQQNGIEWMAPVLYTRSPDGMLFQLELPRVEPSPVQQQPSFAQSPVQQQAPPIQQQAAPFQQQALPVEPEALPVQQQAPAKSRRKTRQAQTPPPRFADVRIEIEKHKPDEPLQAGETYTALVSFKRSDVDQARPGTLGASVQQQPVDVTLELVGKGVEIFTEPQRVRIPARGSARPARFDLVAKRPGKFTLSALIHQDGTSVEVGKLRLTVVAPLP